MKAVFDLQPRWGTQWCGTDIVVLRNEVEVDRVSAPAIRRIVFVQTADTLSAGESTFALVELDDVFVVFPADTGLAGRVHFERQAFWAAKACVFWATGTDARLPSVCLARRGLTFTRRAPRYGRVSRAELAPLVEGWTLEGPHSWDERRWQRIERSRPFAGVTAVDSRLMAGTGPARR